LLGRVQGVLALDSASASFGCELKRQGHLIHVSRFGFMIATGAGFDLT